MQTSIKRIVFLVPLLLSATGAQAQEGFQLDTLTMETRSGSELGSSSNQGRMGEFFKAQKQAVYHILNQVGVAKENLPADIRAAIDRPQTNSFQALVAFSSGLDALDNERFDQAKTFFDSAAKMDPAFGLAVALRDAMPEPGQTVQTVTTTSVNKAQVKAARVVGKAKDGGGSGEAKSGEGGSGEGGSGETKSGEGGSGEGDAALATGGSDAEGSSGSGAAAVTGVEVLEAGTNRTTTPLTTTVTTVAVNACDANPATCAPPTNTVRNSLGLYSTQVLRGLGGVWTNVVGTYATSAPIALNTKEALTIAQSGGGNGSVTVELQSGATANGTMANYARQVTAGSANGDTVSGLTNRMTRTVATTPDSYLELGYYNLTGWTATCGTSTCDYHTDRVYFAEGIATPATDLTTLHSSQASHSYSGTAAADIMHLTGVGTDSVTADLQSGTGTFSGTVNYGTSQVSGVNIAVPTTDYKVTVTNGSGTLNSGGSFSLGSSAMQVGTLAAPGNVDSGSVAGQVFGPSGSSVGGIFEGSRAVSGSETYTTTGNFGGAKVAGQAQ